MQDLIALPPPHIAFPGSGSAMPPPDFAQRMRAWLARGPVPAQVELVASRLEQAGHRETAGQLRSWAERGREPSAPLVPPVPSPAAANPSEPATPPPAPAPPGSPASSSEPGSADSPSSGDGSGARSPGPSGSAVSTAEARRIAPHVVARLQAQGHDSTDRGLRRLVRRFQRAAGLEVDGVYGPATHEALRRFGVRAPPPVRAAR